jgi:hypothetical protein
MWGGAGRTGCRATRGSESTRVGAELLAIAPRSMTIIGTVAEWEGWTGMVFPDTDLYVVPGALVPVAIDRARDEGAYVEPNVWMRHPLTPPPSTAIRSSARVGR